MERWSFVFTCSVYFNILVILVSGLTLHNCIDGWIDIPEDTSTLITCSNIFKTEKVTWTVENAIRNKVFEHECGDTTSCNLNSSKISLQRYRDDGVSLIINRNHRRYGGFTVTCSTTTEHAECRMHVFHAAELSHCRTEINSQSWRVTATCHINKFFSSKEKARCEGRVEPFMPEQSLKNYTRVDGQPYLQKYIDQRNNNTYYRGTCSFTSNLPTSAGNYSYIINIMPGTSLETAGKVLIGKSEANCTFFLEENPKGSCECFERGPSSFPTTQHYDTGVPSTYVCNLVRGSTWHSGHTPQGATSPPPQITRSRPPLETTREMHTEHPTQPLIKTSQVTHVTTFPNSKGLGSSPSDRIDSSPSPQDKSGLSVATGVIVGVVVAVVATVIVIVAIAYVSRRYRNPPDLEEQYNVFYISADALALNTIRPVDDLPQSRVQVSDSQASPQTSSDFTDTSCMVQMENNSIVSPPAHQTQTTQPCLKELEETRESAMSNTENLYAVVADKDLRGSKPRV
ncbi:uncharacterized protein LOC112568135 isoform X1 [Pomacea canaliculata]|uniref:uncharacterized protein LOC112568135 isoform X1 n=1 Tax=Pomacea canaliculata TaxID=400727 RepID=UPI000D73DE0F|nr:uncharacterized protein LOC112568135 isoform X1 [Pomacea canaliculata]